VVLDTSALVAVLIGEPIAPRLITALELDPVRLVSAASVVEAGMVLLARVGPAGDLELDRLLRQINATVMEVDEEQARLARDAAAEFGRGRHPAALNFGDCFSYALAVATSEPLLFVGDDFARTDVARVAW
jgi:ribonuclease VapC